MREREGRQALRRQPDDGAEVASPTDGGGPGHGPQAPFDRLDAGGRSDRHRLPAARAPAAGPLPGWPPAHNSALLHASLPEAARQSAVCRRWMPIIRRSRALRNTPSIACTSTSPRSEPCAFRPARTKTRGLPLHLARPRQGDRRRPPVLCLGLTGDNPSRLRKPCAVSTSACRSPANEFPDCRRLILVGSVPSRPANDSAGVGFFCKGAIRSNLRPCLHLSALLLGSDDISLHQKTDCKAAENPSVNVQIIYLDRKVWIISQAYPLNELCHRIPFHVFVNFTRHKTSQEVDTARKI